MASSRTPSLPQEFNLNFLFEFASHLVFLVIRQKHELPAGDHGQFWKLGRQYSIFGRIGDQWVTMLSPVNKKKLESCHGINNSTYLLVICS